MTEEIRVEMVEAQPINIEIVEAEIASVEVLVPGDVGPPGPPGPATEISIPPPGKYKVINIYVNEHRKLVVEYDTTPAP